MKKIKKTLSIVTFVFLFIFVLVSCNDNNTATTGNGSSNNTSTPTVAPTTPTVAPSTPSSEAKMSDEEVKTNFDNYVKTFNLSKTSINKFLNEAVRKVNSTDIDVSALLDNVNLSNSSAIVNAYKNNEVKDTYSAYLWQEAKVIYLGYNHDSDSKSTVSSAKIDLAKLSAIVGALKSYLPESPKEDVDYVDMVLSQMSLPEGFDLDAILGLIKFDGNDFDYSDGYFSLKMDKVVDLICSLTNADKSTIEETIANIGKFDFKLGYNGKNFTGFKFEFTPKLTEENSSGNVKVELTLNYVSTLLVGCDLEVSVKSVEKGVTICDSKVKASVSLLGVSVDANIKLNIDEKVKLDLKAIFNATKAGIDLSINGTVSVPTSTIYDKTTNSYTLNYTDYKLDLTLKLNDSKLELVINVNDHKFADINLVLNKYVLVSGKIILDANGLAPEEKLDVDKYVVELNTKDVAIPLNYKNSEETAFDVVEYLMKQIIGGGDSDVTPSPSDTDLLA